MNTPIKLMLVDDHRIITDGLKVLLSDVPDMECGSNWRMVRKRSKPVTPFRGRGIAGYRYARSGRHRHAATGINAITPERASSC